MLENKLGITDSTELARAEEKLSKQKALEMFESGFFETLEPGTYKSLAMIHQYLFEEIYDFAGKLRKVNISKGNFRFAPLMYLEAALQSIDKMPQSTFDEIAEKYVEMNVAHPFREGNTRATAVFIIKYMKTFGLKVDNDAFKKHSWYFRNALVRANYNDLKNGIHATTKYLEMFFSNLLMGTDYELKNRYMHVDYVPEQVDNTVQSAVEDISKGKICTLNCPLDELAILKLIIENPNITQKEIANRIGKSERTIKNKVASLKEKGYIQRLNGKRNGKWEVLIDFN